MQFVKRMDLNTYCIVQYAILHKVKYIKHFNFFIVVEVINKNLGSARNETVYFDLNFLYKNFLHEKHE